MRSFSRAMLMSIAGLLVLAPAIVLPLVQAHMEGDGRGLVLPLPERYRGNSKAKIETVRHGPYTVRILDDVVEDNIDGHCVAEIWHGERLLWQQEDYKITFFPLLADWNEAVDDPTGPRVADINADGYPEVILYGWSGGAHAAFTYWVWSLRPTPTCLLELPLGNGTMSLVDSDHDGSLEMRIFDDTFAYWRTCFAASPMPTVLLRWNGWRYRVADEQFLEIKPEWVEQQIETVVSAGDEAERRKAFQENGKYSPTSGLWSVMLDLIYAGEGRLALEVFYRAWPEGAPGATDFLRDFDQQLNASPFYPLIVEETPLEKRWPSGPYADG